MLFAHRKSAEKLRKDIDRYLAQGNKIRQIPAGVSGENANYGRLNTTASAAAKSRGNGQKARGRQKKVQ